MKANSRVTIHMVCSLDGFIAAKDGGVGWLETSDRYEKGVEAEDTEAFLATIGCYLIGARTYETALRLGWPYGDKPTFVLTHRGLTSERSSVFFRSGDLRALLDEELRPRYQSVWVCGGAAVVKEVLRLGLADELCLSIAPILIGEGLPFFDKVGIEQALHLKDVKAYKSGVVELWYERC